MRTEHIFVISRCIRRVRLCASELHHQPPPPPTLPPPLSPPPLCLLLTVPKRFLWRSSSLCVGCSPVVFLLSFFVPYLTIILCLGKAVILDCCISLVSSHILLQLINELCSTYVRKVDQDLYSPVILYADNEGPERTARMRSPIWAFVDRIWSKAHFHMMWLFLCQKGLVHVQKLSSPPLYECKKRALYEEQRPSADSSSRQVYQVLVVHALCQYMDGQRRLSADCTYP